MDIKWSVQASKQACGIDNGWLPSHCSVTRDRVAQRQMMGHVLEKKKLPTLRRVIEWSHALKEIPTLRSVMNGPVSN